MLYSDSLWVPWFGHFCPDMFCQCFDSCFHHPDGGQNWPNTKRTDECVYQNQHRCVPPVNRQCFEIHGSCELQNVILDTNEKVKCRLYKEPVFNEAQVKIFDQVSNSMLYSFGEAKVSYCQTSCFYSAHRHSYISVGPRCIQKELNVYSNTNFSFLFTGSGNYIDLLWWNNINI